VDPSNKASIISLTVYNHQMVTVRRNVADFGDMAKGVYERYKIQKRHIK